MITDKKEDPIEILVIDSDKISVAITHIYFDKVLDNYKDIVDFGSPEDALKYLNDKKDTPPKIIMLETFMPDGQDFSFLEKYASLERTDFIYVASISIRNSDISKCLSYKFVRKYITKPIDINDINNIAKEHKLLVKGEDNTI
jgi:response regulator RpfG family c-di-GMP phosphodiesterase